MKKNICLSLLGLFLLVSCGEGNPGDVYMRYANKIMAGDYEGFVDGFCKNGRSLDVHEDSLCRLMMQEYKSYLDEKYKGLERIIVVRDSIYDGGEKATIRARLHFGNNREEETEYEMCKVDGKWKIELAL